MAVSGLNQHPAKAVHFILFYLDSSPMVINKKLNCILLVDDDMPTNFLHQEMLKRAECVDSIQVTQGVTQALDYLSQSDAKPELILLDLNMPGLDGWEFLAAYKKLPDVQRKDTKILMLTTSLDPSDKQRAEGCQMLSGFQSKPLNQQVIEDIFQVHFPEYLVV
ncbi:MAG: response regulator [Pseudomonadota bacterium]